MVFAKKDGVSFKDLDAFLQKNFKLLLDSVVVGSKYLYNQFVGEEERHEA